MEIFKFKNSLKETLKLAKDLVVPYQIKLYSGLVFTLCNQEDDFEILGSSIDEELSGNKDLENSIGQVIWNNLLKEEISVLEIKDLPQKFIGTGAKKTVIFTDIKRLLELIKKPIKTTKQSFYKVENSLLETCDSLKHVKEIFKVEIYKGLVFTLQNIFLADGKYSWLKILESTGTSNLIKTTLFTQKLKSDWQKKQFETRTKNLSLDIHPAFSSAEMILFHGLYYNVFGAKDLQNLEQETEEENGKKTIIFKNLESLIPPIAHKDLAVIPLQKTFKESLALLEKSTTKEVILMLNADFGLRMTKDETLEQIQDLAMLETKIGYFGYTFAPAGDIGYYQNLEKKQDFARTVANNFAVVKFTLILEEFIKQKNPKLASVWQEFVNVYSNYFPKDNTQVFRLTLTHYLFFGLYFEIFDLKELTTVSYYKILDEKSKWKDSFCYEAEELLELVEKQITHELLFDAPDADLDFDEVIMKLNQNQDIPLQVKKDMISLAKKAFSPKESGAKEDALSKFKLLWKYPFGKMTKDKKFEEIAHFLEENLYGLREAKTRAMRFLAQRELNPNATSQILCLVGEPGVGKTHFAQALAKAVGREFGSIPIGSLSDSKVLRGSSGVYIGSEAGDIFQICNKTQSINPLILLDEIDKIASGYTGGSASVVSALLEIFDPLQQPFFKDSYVNLPIDISKIWFITTANSVDQIHPALIDRMLVLHLPSYTQTDKLQIFDKYIWPEALTNSGLSNIISQISWQQNAKLEFISKFPEAGVRSLKNHTQDFCGMLAVEQLQNQPAEEKIGKKIITKKLVNEYINDVKTWKKDKIIGFDK